MNGTINWRENAVETGKKANFPWRLVRSPDGYYSHFHAKAHAATTLEAFVLGLVPEHDKVQGAVIGTLLKLRKYFFPTYFVGYDFIEAMYRSKLPDLTPADIMMPFPAMIIGLPVKFSLNVFGRHVPYLYIAHIGVGQERLGNSATVSEREKLAVSAVVYEEDIDGGPVSYYAGCAFDQKFSEFDAETSPFMLFYGDAKPDDKKITQLLMAIAVKCIMAAGARPELIINDEAIIQHARVKKGKQKPELWAPRWIGRDYKIIRVKGPPLGGTHASPIAHFRAGHFRMQYHGPKKSLKKQIFIDPVLVNAD